MSATNLPLNGIKIVDLCGPPGEWCSGMLAGFGAEVIMVKSPAQKPETSIFGNVLDTGTEKLRRTLHNPFNRNKKSINLNLKSTDAREVLYKLVKAADVVMEGFRPGVAKRLGVNYEVFKKINPRLIYCSISGYGQKGSCSLLTGHDINYIAISGILDGTGIKDGTPVLPGVNIGDWGGALNAAIAILIAIIGRQQSGKGQSIDISITDTAIWQQAGNAMEYFISGHVAKRGQTPNTGSSHWNNVYKTKDNKYITVGPWEQHLYANLCRVLDREDLIPYQDARGEKAEALIQLFRDIFLTKTRDEWFSTLKDADVCIGPVLSMDEVVNSQYVKERNMLVKINNPAVGEVKQVGLPIKLSDTPWQVNNLAPIQGQDTRSVLTTLGYDKEAIETLITNGSISCP